MLLEYHHCAGTDIYFFWGVNTKSGKQEYRRGKLTGKKGVKLQIETGNNRVYLIAIEAVKIALGPNDVYISEVELRARLNNRRP